MGTRADFYIGRGLGATWLGSVSHDGYPCDKHGNGHGAPLGIITANNVWSYLMATMHYSMVNKRFIRPTEGWPWPWETSRMSDYAYAFDQGKTWISSFGREWITYEKYQRLTDDDTWNVSDDVVFPQMVEAKNENK